MAQDIYSKANILMVVHSYYPDDPRVRREAEALRDNGCPVDLICLRNSGELSYEILNGIRIYRLPVKRHRGKGFITYLAEYLTFFFYATFKTTGLFFRNHYRVIQVHTIPDFLVFCSLIPRLFGASVILDMHEVMPEFFSCRYNLKDNSPLLKVIKFIEKYAIKFSHEVITVSETLKEILVNRGTPPDKITIIMNVADDKIFTYEKARQNISRQSGNVFIMAYHGLLSDIYDLEVVFNALSTLKDKIPDLRFLVIGNGPRQDYYREMVQKLGIEKQVDFFGQRSLEEIPGILESVNLGVVPIRDNSYSHVAFPTKFVEYVASGIPVAIARRLTLERYFDSTSVAFFEPGDDKGLAEIILKLYQSSDMRWQLAQNALKQYQAIEWPLMKKRYYELISKLI